MQVRILSRTPKQVDKYFYEYYEEVKMFTNEFDHDLTTITIMDETGEVGDLIIDAFDDIVYIRQYDEELEMDTILEITPAMFDDLINAIHSTEGSFRTFNK